MRDIKKKRVRCPICGKYEFPTKDHVPPKSCNNKNDVVRKMVFPSIEGVKKDKIIQGGLSFSFICPTCNNDLLGAKTDKELAELFNTVTDSKNDVVVWEGDINNLVKSVFGHILATGEYSKVTYDREMRSFIMKGLMPNHTHLYLLYYPYNDVFLIRTVIPFEYFRRVSPARRMNDKRIVSCFYFYPFAFIVADADYYSGAIDLIEMLKNNQNTINLSKLSFLNPYTKSLLPPCWPCQIGEQSENDTVDVVLSGKEGANAQIVLKR